MSVPYPNAISVGRAILGTIPKPTFDLKWGENISEQNMDRLRNGETALLLDEQGQPHKVLLMDVFGTLREGALDLPIFQG